MVKGQSAVRQPAARRGLVSGALLAALLTVPVGTATAQYPPGPQIAKDGTTVMLQDYVSMPLSTTGTFNGQTSPQLARVNFLRSEPANAPLSSARFFVDDLNANLYILDKTTKTFSPISILGKSFRSSLMIPALPAGWSLLYSTRTTFITASSIRFIPRTPRSAVPRSLSTPTCPDSI